MSLFAIYAKPADVDEPQTLENEDVVLIRDRFSIIACLLTPIWCIWHRLWLELVAYVGVAFIMGFVAFFVGEAAAGWIGFAVAVLIGLEASSIRGYALSRKGYTYKGDVIAANAAEAEYRYVAGQLVQPSQKEEDTSGVKPTHVAPSPNLRISTMPLSNELPKGTVQ